MIIWSLQGAFPSRHIYVKMECTLAVGRTFTEDVASIYVSYHKLKEGRK